MKFIVAVALTVGVVVAVHAGPAESGSASVSARDTLEHFLHGARPTLTSYRAYRRLEASTLGGGMQASLDAWTYVDRGRFGFDIVREEGSSVIRDHVLRKALQTEQQNFNDGETGQVELTTANYTFTVSAPSGDLVTMGLEARRQSPMLLNGTVTVTRQEGDIVRIDGLLSQTPSWWTRRVEIARRYEAIGGVRVPVEMSSRADVRVVGDSNFRMTYQYASINGRAVP